VPRQVRCALTTPHHGLCFSMPLNIPSGPAPTLGIARPSSRNPSGVLGHSCHYGGFSASGPHGRSRAAGSHTPLLHRPALLVLDPLVRLHAIDENAASEIAALLGYYLRALQRQASSAIALVHHARQNVAAHGGAGYSSARLFRSVRLGRFVSLPTPALPPVDAFRGTPLRRQRWASKRWNWSPWN